MRTRRVVGDSGRIMATLARRFGKGIVFGFLVGIILLDVSGAAAIPLAPGSWQTFNWDGRGPIGSPADGYQTSEAVPELLRVVDCCIIGDRFRVFVNTVLAFDTSAILPADDGVQSGLFDGDSAWADARLSKGSVVLGAGPNQIDIEVIGLATGYTSGGAFIRIDESQPTPTPEPSTLLLVGSGIAGAAHRLRRLKILR